MHLAVRPQLCRDVLKRMPILLHGWCVQTGRGSLLSFVHTPTPVIIYVPCTVYIRTRYQHGTPSPHTPPPTHPPHSHTHATGSSLRVVRFVGLLFSSVSHCVFRWCVQTTAYIYSTLDSSWNACSAGKNESNLWYMLDPGLGPHRGPRTRLMF